MIKTIKKRNNLNFKSVNFITYKFPISKNCFSEQNFFKTHRKNHVFLMFTILNQHIILYPFCRNSRHRSILHDETFRQQDQTRLAAATSLDDAKT